MPAPAPAGLAGYPVNLLVAGRRCVVVGAGRIAARKVEALLAAGADVHVVAPELGDEVRAWLDAGRVSVGRAGLRAVRSRRRLARHRGDERPGRQPGGLRGRRGPPGLGERGRRPGQLLVHPDVGACVAGDLVVTIGTGGRSPALAGLAPGTADPRARPRVRDAARAAGGGPGSDAGPTGVPARTPIGDVPSIPACST